MNLLLRTVRHVKRWFKRNFLARLDERLDESDVLEIGELDELEPSQTGEELIALIDECISLRRPFLSIGPRGCGKSWCADESVRRAVQRGIIGSYIYLQGNREIPRDYLSEDRLLIDEEGKPQFLKALALSAPVRRPAPAEYVERLPEHLRQYINLWPAIPAAAVTDDWDPRTLWTDEDWAALKLDEITRFGDGFLDSLLALMEEGKIVRRGVDFFVPLVVVSTANPPGYDPTCKKLSPPLASRKALIVRVTQASFETLVETILPSVVRKFVRSRPQASAEAVAPEHLIRLIAAIDLCLWGDPDSGSPGNDFLTDGSRVLLRQAMRVDGRLRRAMKTLSGMITFGPDARAAQDLLLFGMARALKSGRPLRAADLKAIALPILAGKVRETYNPGTEPKKDKLKELAVREIVARLLENPSLGRLFIPSSFEAARRAFAGLDRADGEARLAAALKLLPAARQEVWLRLLAEWPEEATPADLNAWRQNAAKSGALTREGKFVSFFERAWFHQLLSGRCPAPACDWPFDPAHQWRERLRGDAVLAAYAHELRGAWYSPEGRLESEEGQEALASTLHDLLAPDRVAMGVLMGRLWRGARDLRRTRGETHGYIDALACIDRAARAVAWTTNRTGRARIRRIAVALAVLRRLPIDATAARLSSKGETETASTLSAALQQALDAAWDPAGQGLDAARVERMACWLRWLPRGGWKLATACARGVECRALDPNGAFADRSEAARGDAFLGAFLNSVNGELVADRRDALAMLRTFLPCFEDVRGQEARS